MAAKLDTIITQVRNLDREFNKGDSGNFTSELNAILILIVQRLDLLITEISQIDPK